MTAMKDVLEKTVEVKLEYEEVIKQLLLDDNIKDYVIEICVRQRQTPTSSFNQTYYNTDLPL